MGERLRPPADAEIRALELERHGRARERIRLKTGGDFFRQAPQPQLQRTEIGDVVIEGGLRRNALGLALGAHWSVVEPACEPKQPHTLGPVAAPQLALARSLQIAEGAQ